MNPQSDSAAEPHESGLPAAIAASATAVASYGTARAKPGTADDFAAQVRVATERIRRDPGCEQYQVHTVRDDPDSFVFYERWASGLDLVQHVQQPYLSQYVAALNALVDGEFTWTWLALV